jgi:sporulation protein YlmC with PRC-barrel domain
MTPHFEEEEPATTLSDKTLHGRTVIASDGLAIGSITTLFIGSDGGRLESLQIKLHKDVADRLGADRSWLRAGAVEIPIRGVGTCLPTQRVTVTEGACCER